MIFINLAWKPKFSYNDLFFDKKPNIGPDDILRIHMISHSHDDVGWLKTMDEYFWGTKSNIQTADVEFVLDTVI